MSGNSRPGQDISKISFRTNFFKPDQGVIVLALVVPPLLILVVLMVLLMLVVVALSILLAVFVGLLALVLRVVRAALAVPVAQVVQQSYDYEPHW